MLTFHDLIPGQTTILGSKTVSEEEILRFAKEFDPQPFHIDAAAAAVSPFGGLIASGMRLLVEGVLKNSTSMGSPGVEQIRWVKPVRPGDTLTVSVTVLESKPSTSRPDRGTVKIRTEATNQRGEQVMWMESFGIFGI
jgi:acyl dehydratase